ncbi:MAG: putative lipid II flippase FtsW [Lachnospiraceae bacterium]|nr:putative lipid II flippase FtsW [Lachnospiraceae bacterium]
MITGSMEVVSDYTAKQKEKDKFSVEKKNKPKTYFDYTLLIITLVLVGFGLMMIASASPYYAIQKDLPTTYFVRSQAIKAAIGVALMVIGAKLNYNWLKIRLAHKISVTTILYIVCIALQLVVLVRGNSVNGSSRWITIPLVGQFQPSEVTKLCLILYIAKAIAAKPKRLDRFFGFVIIIATAAPLFILVALENLSTAIIMVGLAFAMCFVASRKSLYYIITVVLMVPVFIFFLQSQGYRMTRVQVWLTDPTGGYQIQQGLYAICAGGWFGKGLGNSAQKRFVPEVHTDMIFTIICEELGLLGVIVLFLVYGLLIWRIAKVALNAPDLFGSLLCVGVLGHISLQVMLNVGVVTKLLPATGVILPFISFGGTSLIILLAEMGIVMSVASRVEYEQ